MSIDKLQKKLKSSKVDAFLVSSSANIFYLTGLNDFSYGERDAYMFVSKKEAYLFTSPLYFEGIKSKLSKSITPVLYSEMFETIGKSKINNLGFENNLTYLEYRKFKKETRFKFVSTNSIVEEQREIKDENEIKNIRAACLLTDEAFNMVRKFIKIGVTERELAWQIEKYIKQNSGELAFDTIVAFGPNSATPHHKTSDKQLAIRDEFVLIDMGAKINGYCADMTRTLLTKNSSARAKNVYSAVLASQQAALQLINQLIDPDQIGVDYKKTIRGQDIAKIANDYIVSSGFEPIPHGLGHGIGIEVHEGPTLSPKSEDLLVSGNAFTIEPGIYIPGFGGVRIEDDFLISKKGLEQLTKSPKGLELSI